MGILQVDVVSLFVVALLSMSPVGEILVAIPAGVALGIDPALVFMVAYVANLLPIAILLPSLDWLERRIPKLFGYFSREGRKFGRQLQGRHGSIIMVLITPIIGVYAASVSTKFLRFSKKHSFTLQSLSLLVYGVIETLGLYFGIKLIPVI